MSASREENNEIASGDKMSSHTGAKCQLIVQLQLNLQTETAVGEMLHFLRAQIAI